MEACWKGLDAEIVASKTTLANSSSYVCSSHRLGQWVSTLGFDVFSFLLKSHFCQKTPFKKEWHTQEREQNAPFLCYIASTMTFRDKNSSFHNGLET